jgi:hypothetical protein
MQDTGVCRNDDILPGVFVKFTGMRRRHGRAKFNVSLRMADPCGGAEKHRKPEFLRKVEGVPHHIMGFLQGRGIETGDTGKVGVTPAVLLILRTVCEGIICTHDDKATGHPGIGAGHEGVCSDIEAHVLHGAERGEAAPCCGEGIFKRDLFIHRPLDIVASLFLHSKGIDHLRRGCPGIAGHKIHRRFETCMRNRFVSEKILSFHRWHPS